MTRPDCPRDDVLAILKRGDVTTGQKIAAEIGRSERSVYRIIADLRTKGVRIVGEAGVGYILRGARRG